MAAAKKRHIRPEEFRARFPDARDETFSDAISVTEAAEILGLTDTWVRKLVRCGSLRGKILTRTCYVVSLSDARKNWERYRSRATSGAGRPRSRG
jgi:hypothetical protein